MLLIYFNNCENKKKLYCKKRKKEEEIWRLSKK